MPTYKYNGDIYDIPEGVVAQFEKDMPDATMAYQVGNDIYDIPLSERDGFLKMFPTASAYEEKAKQQAEELNPFTPQESMFGSLSYADNIGKPEDSMYYPSPLSEEGKADYEPMTPEDRSRQEYEMLMRDLDEFDAQNGQFMNTYEAYEKAAKRQVSEAGYGLDTFERQYLDENNADYRVRKQKRDELNERISNNTYFNQMRMADARAASEAADYLANAAMNERQENHKLELEYALWQANSNLRTGPSITRTISPEALKHHETQEDLQAAERIYRKTAEIYAAPINNGEDILANFGKGIGERANDLDFWTMGLSAIADDINARQAFQKIQNKFGTADINNLSDEEIDALLTPSEQALIMALMDNATATQLRYQKLNNVSGAYQAGAGAADSAMFMAQFLLTGGIGDAATVGTEAHKRLVNYFGRKIGSIENKLLKSVARGTTKVGLGTAEALGKALVMTPLMPHTYANISDKLTDIDDNGQLVKVSDAILSGSIDALIETFSEGTGAFVENVLKVPGKAVKGVAKRVLKDVDFADWGRAMNAPVMKILRQGGFNGFIGEMGEEVIGNAVRAGVARIAPKSGMDPDALKDFMEIDQLMVTAGSFLPMTILGLGGSSIQYGRAKRKLANAQGEFENILREASYTEDQIKFIVDKLLSETDAHLTPEKLMQKFSPILRELIYNDKVSGQDAAAAAVYFMGAIAQYRTMDGVYRSQEREQLADMQNEIQQQTGREFWTTRLSNKTGLDGTAYETDEVHAVEFKDGRVAYILGSDGVTNTVVYNDGTTGFLSNEQLNEGKANGSITSDAVMGLNDYLTQQVARVRMTEDETRMFQERNDKVAQVRAAFPVESEVKLGTEEAPVIGIVRQQTPDGAIVESPNGADLMTWEQLGHTIGIEVNAKTTPEMEEEAINNLEIADLQRRRERQRLREERRHQQTETDEVIEESVDGEINEEIDHPIPTKADGSVDQAAFWNQSPERWAQWKTEQRQDGGAYASTYIQNAIGILEGQIAANEEAFVAESDFDKKDALEQTINQQKERLTTLLSLADQYAPAVVPATEAEAEQSAETTQTQPVVIAERQKGEFDAEYQRRLRLARTLTERVMILQEYFDALSAGSLPVSVVTKQNFKQKMKEALCSEGEINTVEDAIKEAEKKNEAVGGMHANGIIWIVAENNSSVEDGRLTYVHERQHNITQQNPTLIQRILALGLGHDVLASIVEKLSGTKFYSEKSDDVLADEILSFAMEAGYTFEDISVPLSEVGVPLDLINVLAQINDEQRADYSLVNARRSQTQYHNAEERSGQNDADQGEVSTGVLGQEGSRPVENSARGVENGEPAERGTEGRAEAGEEGVQAPVEEVGGESQSVPFRVTKSELPEANLSEETKEELADKGLVMEGGVIMSDDYAELKHETGYATPIEEGAATDYVRFSVVTMPGWRANYLKYKDADERIVRVLEAFAARITANEMVNGVVAQGKHKSSKKTKDGKLVESGPLRSNISYVVTFDLDTSCPRTFQYLNFVRKIERKIGRPLTQIECIQLNEMMRMYGQQIPCVYCYAENKRQLMKQYFTNYIASRHAVLSAETDEEALKHMYGHEAEGTDPKTVLTEAAYKVFLKWRKNPKGTYNPTMRMLWNQYDQARNSVLSLLDMRYAEGVIKTDSADDTIAKFVASELGVTNRVAVREIEEMVVEWKWNTIEGKKHDDFTPMEEDDLYANENALEVWRDMTLYAKSASGAKNVNRYVPYTDELKNVDQATRDYINGMGGLRMHSTNDFRIDYVFDYFQFLADMAAAKMFGHTYTKSPEFVRIFGNSGYKINMSIAAYQDGKGVIRPNVDEGFDWNEAKELRRLFPHAGTMLMATSDEQLQMALDSDWIDMVIPFHHSGLPKVVWYNMRLWTDYTSVQNEEFFNTKDRIAMLTEAGVEVPKRATPEEVEEIFNEHFGIVVKFGDNGKRVKPHFLPGPTIVNGVDIPGHNNDHKLYLELCKKWGVKPRFQGIKVKDNTPEGGGREVDITEHPRYMILVKETARTDSPQTAIQFNFDQPSEALGGKSPMDYAFEELEARAMAETELAGEKVKDIYNSLNNDSFGIVEQFLNTIIRHKQETGEEYPMDYLTPESREWFLTQRKALEEAFRDVATIPYHRNEYDEQGNLISGPGLKIEEEKKVVDILEEAKKANAKNEAKKKATKKTSAKKGKKDEGVRMRITPRTEEQRDKLFEEAKKKYGATNNFNAAGYMLPDGTLLDFSEANDGGNPNQRSLDHRDIEGIIMDEGREYDTRYHYIVDFVNEGAIRMLPESAGFQLSVPPTAEQRSRLMDYFYKHNGEVIMEITNENGGNEAYVEYDRRTSPSRIMRDMDGYFKDGTVPQQDVRFRIGNARKEQMRQGMTSKLTSMSEDQIESTIAEIEKLGEESKKGGDSKLEKIAYHWVMKGAVILPEDNYKIVEAIKVAEKAKVNPMDYDSPMAIINEFQQFKTKEKPVDPDTIKEFSNKEEHGNGIVIYDVQDDFEGQAAVRKVIDTHWGVDANPWCLAARQNGNLERAKEMWEYYNRYPKRIAFKDGELCAFFASRGKKTWWDRNDKAHDGIPYAEKTKEGDFDVARVYEKNEKKKKPELVSTLKENKKDGIRIESGVGGESLLMNTEERTLRYGDAYAGYFLSDRVRNDEIIVRYNPYREIGGVTLYEDGEQVLRADYGAYGLSSISFEDKDGNKWDCVHGWRERIMINHSLMIRFLPNGGIFEIEQGQFLIENLEDGNYNIKSYDTKIATIKEGEYVVPNEEISEDKARVINDIISFVNSYGWKRSAFPYADPRESNPLRNPDIRKRIENAEAKVRELTEDIPSFPVLKSDKTVGGVRFRASNNNQAIFVSNAAKAVEGIKMEKATPEQWLKMIEKNGGLKAGEDKWMGLSDWLKASNKKTLTKAEVLDFINENMIVIEEVHYSGKAEDDAASQHDFLEQRVNERYKEILNSLKDIEDYDERRFKAFDQLREELGEFGDLVDIERYGVYLTFSYTDLSDYIEMADYFGVEIKSDRGIHEMHEHYTTNGLANLHEIALTVPTIEPYRGSLPEVHFFDAGEGRAIAWVRFGETELREELEANYEPKNEIEQQIKNYIERCISLGEDFDTCVGYAYNQITDAPNEAVGWTEEAVSNVAKGMRSMKISKVLVIDEIQSQRHQDGREKGYKDAKKEKATKEAFEKASRAHFANEHELREKYGDDFINARSDDEIMQVITEEEYRNYDALRDAYLNARLDIVNPRYGAIPDAPFEKNWSELAMKRMLRYAAENGYDAIAWTKGDQQNARYNLARYYDFIERDDHDSLEGRRFELSGRGRYDNIVVDEVGEVVSSSISGIEGKPLADVVGKALATNMMALENGDDIDADGIFEIGGEGMKGFYDKMLPSFVNKYGKKWGIKVEDMNLSHLESGLTMHSIPVTEEMKESVMEGQVMFRITPHQSSIQEVSDMFYKWNKDADLVPIFRKAIDFCEEVHADIKFVSREEMKKLDEDYGGGLTKGISFGNKIRYNADVFNWNSRQENATTILHEMLHLCTYYVLSQNNNKLEPELVDAKNNLEAIFDKIKSKYPMRYGSFDIDEMVAEMSNPSFRNAMKKGNLWERFVNATGEVLGLEKTDNNRLDPVMDALNRILDNPDFVLFDDELQDLSKYSEFVSFRITPKVQEEMDAIKASAIVMGNFMKAPNGKDTNLTEEQWLMTRTKNFQKWFGEWINDPENASKVVDENGEPKVVYHGSTWRPLLEEDGKGAFKQFEGMMGKGTYFTDEFETAYDYAAEKYAEEFGEDKDQEFLDDNGYITEAFLNIRDEEDIFPNGNYNYYVARNANQIKSAVANTGEFSEENPDIRFKVVTDKETLDRLNSEPTIKVYRAMQLIDGKLYPPMSAKVNGKLRKPIELGVWEESEEMPELADSKGYFTLNKGNGKAIKARYNPYFHASYTPLNDQFSEAQSRPNLVIVEVEIPVSELTSGYKADKAKDSVGEKEWKAGVIQGKLSGTRKVVLSRWDKPVRIVPDSEVADVIVKMFEGKDITMPSNVVTPSLRAELEKRGVPFIETDNQGKPVKPTFIDVIKTLFAKGKDVATKLYQRSFFDVAKTPAFMKELGLTGDRFTVRYGVIARHFGKDSSHDLTEEDWQKLPEALKKPFAITKLVSREREAHKNNGYRLYTALQNSKGEYVVVGVDVKNAGRDIEVNAIATVFGRRENAHLPLDEEVIYRSKKITPEQSSLLERPNSSQYPIGQELSEDKGNDNIDTTNESEENISLRVTGTPTEDIVAEGVNLSKKDLATLAGNIFTALPEDVRKKITDGLNGNPLRLQDAILQIPTSLAIKEEWNDEERALADIVAEQMTKAVGKEMTRPFSASEALWVLYNTVNKSTDMVSEASRALVRRNLGFAPEALEMDKDAGNGVRFRTVGNASVNATASLYNKGAVNVWTRIKESFVDMNAAVEKMVKAMEKNSGKVAQGFENILLALNQQSSKGLAAMERYTQKYLNPMFDEILKILKSTDYKYADVVRYVILKHGLERNDKFAKRDAREFYQAEYEQKVAAINADQNLTDVQKQQKRDDAKKELDSHLLDIDWGIDAKYKELRETDYSGISSMFYDQLGVNRKDYETEEEYQAALMDAKRDKYATLADIENAAYWEVTDFENAVKTDALWDAINKATKETLKQQYQANMISKDQYENLSKMFDFYVPLRGFADNTAEDMYTYFRKPNSTGYTKPILGAEGRKTEAESPFGWIASMAGSAIASNVKNEAKLALFYFVSNRPDNGIATISKTWFVQTGVDASGKKIFSPTYPPFNEDLSTDAAKQAYEDWQKQMRDLRDQGQAYESGQRLNLGNAVVNIDEKNRPEHIVNVKVGGKDYTIVINGNPRAAQAINGDLNIEQTGAADYTSVFGPMLRWMSSVNTSYNPEFWITNMQRDMLFTLMAVNTKEDPAYRRRFAENYRKAFKVISLVAKNENGTLGNSYIERMYKDFVEYGGVTGYTQIKDNETWEKEIENYIKSKNSEDVVKGVVLGKIKDGFHAMHRFGESLEQVSRFAAFLTSREMGKSMSEAINDAKEITVNFNRKGSGKRITWEESKYLTNKKGQPLNWAERAMAVGLTSIAPLGRRFIMFFNAAIQGLNAMYKLYKKNPSKMIGWSLGYAALGVMNALVHAMLDDDDDYLDMPQYERRNSLMLGGNGVYFKWAVPQEARVFYALGDLAVESIMGRNPHQNVVGEALKIGSEILPINPSEGWKAFMPSAAIPFIELGLNEDYKGAPIYNEQKWLTEEERKRTAKWAKAYTGTSKVYIDIAKALNGITGGDEYDAGWINLQPEKMEHIVQSAFGGTIRTIDKFVATIAAAFDPEEEVTMRQAPFLNRFLTINDERFKNVHVNDVYDYYEAEVLHAQSLAKQYKKDRNLEAYNKVLKSEQYEWSKVYSKYKDRIKKYQEKIKVADTTAERMRLMKEQDELKRRMIKEISEL